MSELDRHSKVHLAQDDGEETIKMVACDVCDKLLKGGKNLENHKKKVHAKGGTIPCPFCENYS